MDLGNRDAMGELATALTTRLMIDGQLMAGERKDGAKRFWTTREEAIIRDKFPGGGINACLPLLPGRSAGSIYQKAANMRLRKRNRAGGVTERQRYSTSEAIDAAIRRCFTGETPRSEAVAKLCAATGRPRVWINNRARVLGLVVPRYREGRWSEREVEILRAAGAVHPDTIRRRLKGEGFKRTSTAILLKQKSLRIMRDLDENGHYTATALGECFGVSRDTVARWADLGLLAGHRLKGHRSPEKKPAHDAAFWQFSLRAVRQFVVENVAIIDFHKVDKFWLVDLLAGSVVGTAVRG
jgi:hypothetical protein